MTTARLVLNLAKGERINEDGLGVQGITYLRAKGARIERIKARTPWADNEATELLLSERIPFTERSELPRIVDSEPNEDTEQDTEPLRTVREPEGLDEVLEAWDNGRRTLDAIMGYTGFTQHKVRVCVAFAREHGYIEDERITHTQEVQA